MSLPTFESPLNEMEITSTQGSHLLISPAEVGKVFKLLSTLPPANCSFIII